MSGIVGLIGDGTASEVRAMADRMPHRGTAVHVWSPAPRVQFGWCGNTELAAGRQLVADAELDEHSLGDLAARLERGVHELRDVSGYFALAYWDEVRRRVVLAVDTSGFKSLYYVELEGRVAFASEYKALLALGDLPAELDRDAAQHYLAARSFRMERPLLRGVQSITAGCVVSAHGTTVRAERYWTAVPRVERRPRASFAGEVRATLERVVARQSRRFERAGITLSGGLDSACVLALLRSTRPDLPIASYTIGFGDGDAELEGGRELAEAFGTEHREVVFEPRDVPAYLPTLVWLMEDCTGREEALLQHLVLAEAARHEIVVFGGYGADMLFAGMPRYRLVRLREDLPPLAQPLAELFQYTQTGAKPGTWLGKLAQRLLKGGAFPPPSVVGASGPARVADDLQLDRYIASQMYEAQDSGYVEPSLQPAGVQFRDPFQCTEMMELALRIPGRYNVGWRRQKMVLREAVGDLLPPSVARRGKSLQRVRHDVQLSDVLDEMAARLLTPQALRERGIVAASYVRDLRRRNADRPYTTAQLYRLWTLLCLELWHVHFIDNRGRSEAVLDLPEPSTALPAA